MSPKYKLTYFNLTGLGEPIRYIFAYGNIDFEDNRVERATWDDKQKQDYAFGKLPVLEIDGKPVTQSAAICRYLAKKVGLAGKTDLDALEADAIVDTLVDFRMSYSGFFTAKDEATKAAKLEEAKESNKFYLERLDKIVADNGGHFVKNQLTWADIVFSTQSEVLKNITKQNILENYANLAALKEKVDNLPGIKEYRAKRPVTLL